MKIFSILRNPRTLIITGVMMTIMSAGINHSFIDSNNSLIEEIQKEISSKETIIDNRWQQTIALEQREDFATILSMLSRQAKQGDEKSTDEIVRFVEKTASLEGSGSSQRLVDMVRKNNPNWLNELYKVVKDDKHKTIEDINQLYGEKISLEERVVKIKEQNSTSSGIALFLQIMGMILVLSHEAWRKT